MSEFEYVKSFSYITTILQNKSYCSHHKEKIKMRKLTDPTSSNLLLCDSMISFYTLASPYRSSSACRACIATINTKMYRISQVLDSHHHPWLHKKDKYIWLLRLSLILACFPVSVTDTMTKGNLREGLFHCTGNIQPII